MSFLSGKLHSGIFSKKEEKKAPMPEPKTGMFSGLSVKAVPTKPVENIQVSSGYSPPFIGEVNTTEQNSPMISTIESIHNRKPSAGSSSSQVEPSRFQDTSSNKSIPLGMIDLSSNRGSSRVSDSEVRNLEDPFASIQFDTRSEVSRKKVDIPMTFKSPAKKGTATITEDEVELEPRRNEPKKVDIPMTFKSKPKNSTSGFNWSDDEEEQFRKKTEAAKKENPIGGGLPSFVGKKTSKDLISSSMVEESNEPIAVFRSTSTFGKSEMNSDFDRQDNIHRLERDRLAREKEFEDERLEREEQIQKERLQKEKERQEKQKDIERRVQERLRKEQEEKDRKEKVLREKQEEERKRRVLYEDPTSLQLMISTQIQFFTSEIDQRNKTQEQMTETQLQTLAEIKVLEEEIKETEEKQAEAAYNEEFELAEQFNDVLEGLQETIKLKKEELKQNSTKYSQLEDEKSEVYGSQLQFLEELISECSHISAEEELNLSKVQVEFTKTEEKKTEELKKKRIELSAKQEQATALLDENKAKKSEIEEKIYSQTQDLQEERTGIQDKVTQLDQEIEELLKLLAEKQEAKRIIQADLDQVNYKIGEFTQNFESELYEINDEEEKLIEYNNELQEEHSQLEQEEQNLTSEIHSANSLIDEKSYKIQLYKECLEVLTSTQQSLTSTLESRLSYLQQIKDLESLIYSKVSKISEAENYQISIRSDIEFIKQTIIRQEDRINEIDIKIPKLESDKKIAASNKQFKEAGKLAAEMKSYSLEQEELLSQMKKLRSEISSKEAVIEEVNQTASELQLECIGLKIQVEEAKDKILKLLSSS